jgi:hypothetical protein
MYKCNKTHCFYPRSIASGFLLRLGVPAQAILLIMAHRYHAVPSPGYEPTTLWLSVRHPNHLAIKAPRQWSAANSGILIQSAINNVK